MNYIKNQSGAVLITSLVILTILSLLTVSASRSTMMQERMSFGARDSHYALQGAELALWNAENYLENSLDLADFSDVGTNGLYNANFTPQDLSVDSAWADGITAAAADTVNSDVTAGRYFIEHLGELGDISVDESIQICPGGMCQHSTTVANSFRIVARGKGLSDNSQRIIISYYNVAL